MKRHPAGLVLGALAHASLRDATLGQVRRDTHRGVRVQPRHMDEVSAELWCKSRVFIEVDGDTVHTLDVEALVIEIERCHHEALTRRGEALLDVLRRIYAQLGEHEAFKAMAVYERVLALLGVTGG